MPPREFKNAVEALETSMANDGGKGMTKAIDMTDDERRYLVAILRGEAATRAARFERSAQVTAELLIGKLEGRYSTKYGLVARVLVRLEQAGWRLTRVGDANVCPEELERLVNEPS